MWFLGPSPIQIGLMVICMRKPLKHLEFVNFQVWIKFSFTVYNNLSNFEDTLRLRLKMEPYSMEAGKTFALNKSDDWL